jgi:ATP-dependent Clp protease ATP-binding subunit ClpC
MDGMGLGARRAVEAAEVEARGLGHDRIGTEHLLLGLLAGETTAAAEALKAAGLTLAAVRHKVGEAVGPSGGAGTTGELARTARAERAIARSVRFSHARHADTVATEHLLLGVLDVEGTAGQVLRGLGVDLDRLRASLDGTEPGPAPEPPAPAPPAGARCGGCGSVLAGRVAYEVLEAEGPRGQRDVVVLACAECGHVLGVAKA